MIAQYRIGVIIVSVAIVFGVGGVWSCASSLRADEPAERIFSIAIEDGKVARDVRTLRVTQGDNVRMRWTSDKATVLHLHGYDIEKKVVPGSVAEFSFKAHAAGRYAVETHGDGSSHHHGPPLVVLEVHPR